MKTNQFNSEYISKSQAECLEECPRKFAYRYIEKVPEPKKSKALAIGSAFHALIEGDNATFDSLTMELERDAYPHGPVLKKMKLSYDEATHELPQVKKAEVEFLHESPARVLVKGYVDAVRVEPSGAWFISETKTASSVDKNKHLLLSSDLQVATYVAARAQVALAVMVDPALFQGVIYSITTKPRERLGKKESADEYVARCSVETHVWKLGPEIVERAEKIAYAKYTYADEMRSYIKSVYQKSGNADLVPQNQKSCFNYNSPCPYFERCYGVKPCQQISDAEQ